MLLESLHFEQSEARQETIRDAHAKTCRWFLNDRRYVDWLDAAKLDNHHGFLWLKGNPGTGKSTIMKFVFSTAWEKKKKAKVLAFFFNARGGDLEKSTEGMYRTILLQLF